MKHKPPEELGSEEMVRRVKGGETQRPSPWKKWRAQRRERKQDSELRKNEIRENVLKLQLQYEDRQPESERQQPEPESKLRRNDRKLKHQQKQEQLPEQETEDNGNDVGCDESGSSATLPVSAPLKEVSEPRKRRLSLGIALQKNQVVDDLIRKQQRKRQVVDELIRCQQRRQEFEHLRQEIEQEIGQRQPQSKHQKNERKQKDQLELEQLTGKEKKDNGNRIVFGGISRSESLPLPEVAPLEEVSERHKRRLSLLATPRKGQVGHESVATLCKEALQQPQKLCKHQAAVDAVRKPTSGAPNLRLARMGSSSTSVKVDTRSPLIKLLVAPWYMLCSLWCAVIYVVWKAPGQWGTVYWSDLRLCISRLLQQLNREWTKFRLGEERHRRWGVVSLGLALKPSNQRFVYQKMQQLVNPNFRDEVAPGVHEPIGRFKWYKA